MPFTSSLKLALLLAGSCLSTTPRTFSAQTAAALPANYIHVSAPAAERLVIATKTHHPEIIKLGLHATPPSASANAIIASDAPGKIGKKSSDKDMQKLSAGKPVAERIEKDGIYDLFLPITDKQGRDIGQGFVVMEVPLKNASSEEQALLIGASIRDEIQQQVVSRDALYQ